MLTAFNNVLCVSYGKSQQFKYILTGRIYRGFPAEAERSC
jgi:hypothetical protein